MIFDVLEKLQKLQSELAQIDPSNETHAIEAVAGLAGRLRDTIRATDRSIDTEIPLPSYPFRKAS